MTNSSSSASEIGTDLRDAILNLAISHDPSLQPFFARLHDLPRQRVTRSLVSGIYNRFQAGMHSSRVMVYFTPRLDRIDLRMEKLHVIADDDGIPGDSHHMQMHRTFSALVATAEIDGSADSETMWPDEMFGELDVMIPHLDLHTAQFVLRVKELYPRSLGPWLVVESFAHEFIGALQAALSPHFPNVGSLDYFVENFSSCVEERHRDESIRLAQKVLNGRPELYGETIDGAIRMAEALDGFWQGLDEYIR